MNRWNYVFIPFLAGMLALAGCGGKEAKAYRPASPLYEAAYDRTVPAARIDVADAVENPSAVRLSEIASEIIYIPVGDQTFPVTQVIALADSFITFNKPRLFLCWEGRTRKRIGFKALINKWGNAREDRNLYYDKETTRLYLSLKEPGKEQEADKYFIGELPPLDSILPRERYIAPDSIGRKYYLNTDEELFAFSSEGYMLRDIDSPANRPTGITAFNLKGDTLCRFPIPPGRTGEEDSYSTSWQQDGIFTFRLSCNDTIYRLKDRQTIAPAYAIDMGNYRAGIDSIIEGNKSLFLKLSTGRYVVYLKEKGKTTVLPYKSGGLTNDLDNGLPFWPHGQTEGWLYQIRHVTDLLDEIYETGPHRNPRLRDYLTGLRQNQFIMILVR